MAYEPYYQYYTNLMSALSMHIGYELYKVSGWELNSPKLGVKVECKERRFIGSIGVNENGTEDACHDSSCMHVWSPTSIYNFRSYMFRVIYSQ